MQDIFLAQNPWRTEDNWQVKGLITRRIQPKIWDWMDENDVLIISGARQTGKTTLFKQLISDLISEKQIAPKNIFYFSFNDYNLRRAILKKPAALFNLIDQQKEKTQRAYIFLDEIQRASIPAKLLKIYSELSDYKFIVSTSSALELSRNIKEDVFSQVLRFHLYPLTFREFLSLRCPDQDVLPPERILEASQAMEGFFQDYANFDGLSGVFEGLKPYQRELSKVLKEYLLIGGLPTVAKDEVPQALARLKEINQLYIEKDILEILRVEKHFALFALLELAAKQTGNMLRLDELGENLGISFPTLKNFMNILGKTYMIEFLGPYSENQNKGLRKTKKPYFLDPGLRNAWANLTELPEDISLLAENLVFSLLKRFNSYLLDDFCELLFFRTYDGAEVDFLLKARDIIFPIEVKYQSFDKPRVPIGLQNFMKANEIPTGVVVTNDFLGIAKFAFGEVYFLPLNLLLFMV